MKKLTIYATIALALTACHPLEEYDRTNAEDFEALWTIVDEHYCFFDYKEIDWQQIHDQYAPKVENNELTRRQFFSVCAAMLNELRDGHTNLSSGFETSYYRAWWSDYPENFSDRLIEQGYFDFKYRQLGSVIYGVLPQNVGYVRIPSFSTAVGTSNIDWIFADLALCNGLIIDVRNNGGGNVSYAETWIRSFLIEPITACYMVHKTGPGHSDFAEPEEVRYEPNSAPHKVWTKPVILLTNRSTFSAANYFTAVMRTLPQVTHCGATTGGGSGMPMTYELPGGWAVRLSAVSVLDPEGRITEFGIPPAEGCAVDMDPTEALLGIDTMLEFAITLIK